MWQSSSHRNWSRNQGKRRKQRSGRPAIHVVRTGIEIKVGAGLGQPSLLLKGRGILNELTATGFHFFTSQKLESGQEIALTLQEPKRIYVKARVVGCKSVEGETRIITEETYPYRVSVAFQFGSEQEKAELQAYCSELQNGSVRGAFALAVA